MNKGHVIVIVQGQMPELLLDLDAASGASLRARTTSALREAVRSRRLAPGTRLPPTRALATQLGVSRGVVVEAYAQLAAEGYLVTRRGGGTTVATGTCTTSTAPGAVDSPRVEAKPVRFDLRPALPAVDGFPRGAWAAAVGRVLREVPDARLGYPEPFGEPEWRAALAAWLGRRRGVRAAPEQVVATGSLRAGLPLVWELLAARGVRRVGVEDPGWRRVGQTLRAAGLEPVALGVDADGLDVAALRAADTAGAAAGAGAARAVRRGRDPAAGGIDAVVVTPAHQFPTGAVLSAERRAALVAWARERGAWVVEDDYDAEFRYDRRPVGSLQGLAPDVVVHGGSTSKLLAPALRQGWLVLPPALAAELHPDRHWGRAGTPSPLDQLALTDLLQRGELDRHLRRQRLRYARRRDALMAALAAELPDRPVRGAAAGLFLVVGLAAGTDEDAVVAAALAAGLPLEGLRATTPAGVRDAPGLVVGYANLDAASAPAAARAVAALVAG